MIVAISRYLESLLELCHHLVKDACSIYGLLSPSKSKVTSHPFLKSNYLSVLANKFQLYYFFLHISSFQVELGPAPLLWELGNNAVRPLIYFMTNPAVWDGLRILCCKKKNQLVNEDDEEIEIPLSPVTTV